MDTSLLLSERMGLVGVVTPQLKNNGAVSSRWMPVNKATRLLAIINNAGGDTTLDGKIEAATDGLGTGVKTVKSMTQIANASGTIAAPTTALTLSTGAGLGALPAATYFARYTFIQALPQNAGPPVVQYDQVYYPETTANTEGSQAVAVNGSLICTTPVNLPAGTVGIALYVSTATTTETFQGYFLGTVGAPVVATLTRLAVNDPAYGYPVPVVNSTGSVNIVNMINTRVGELGDGFNFARVTLTVGAGSTGVTASASLWAGDFRYGPAAWNQNSVAEIIR
jgi:hypothetical protein